jgi:hypothetical protein
MWSRNYLPFRSTRVHTLVFSGVRVARSLVFCVVRGNQKLYIEEEQTIQCPQDAKRVIRSCTSKDRQYNTQKKNDKTPHRKLKIEQHEPH